MGTGLALLVAAVAIVRWHPELTEIVGGVLSPASGASAGSSQVLIALVFGLLVGPSVVAAAVAGRLAHRRPAIRWPPAVVAVATVPLEVLWMVLVAPDVAALVAVLVFVVGVLATGLGYLAFRLARREIRERGSVPDVDRRTRTADGDEHSGE